MKGISREPVAWASFIAGTLSGLVTLGVLTSDQVDGVNGWVQAALPLISLLLPFVGGLAARRRTVPTDEPEAVKVLERNGDGVYRSPVT